MNTKTILGISFAAVFAVSMMMLPISAEKDIPEVEDDSANCPSGVTITHASKNTVGDVTILDNVLVVSQANLGLTGDVNGDAFAFTLTPGVNSGLCLNPHT